MADRILILGASARAAAASARRAGLDPFAIDLFADADTRRICECVRCPPDEYPEGLFRRARAAPPMPWMYTGGLENYPELVGELERERELWGNGSTRLEHVRDPFRLHGFLTADGIPTPPVSRTTDCPADGRWLTKPLRGSAGHGIGWFDRRAGQSSRPSYLQRFVSGTPMSAVFVSMPWRAYLLGVTRQLVGEPWLHAGPFAYCGSVGPITLPDAADEVLHQAGATITQAGLRFGLFGVDFVLDDVGCPHVIEVNPRYPASAEILDHGSGTPVMKWHVDCARCLDDGIDPDQEWAGPVPLLVHAVVGKAIYYAPHRITFPRVGPWDESLANAADVWRRPDFADIPHASDAIEPGHPVLTILTEADTEAECLRRLQSRAAELDRHLGAAP